jgi:hypothetical protein
MHRSTPFVITAALAALGASSAHAAAPKVVGATYDAAFAGVYHAEAQESEPGAMAATRTMDLTWAAETATPLRLSPSVTHDTAVAVTETPRVALSGSYHEVIESEPPTIQDCALSLDGAPAPGLVGASTADGTITIDFTPFTTVQGVQRCSLPVSDPGVAFLGHDFAGKVRVPVARLGDATIVVPVESDASLPCPAYDLTTSCDVHWSGTLTLTRRTVVTERAHATKRPKPVDDDIEVAPLVSDDDIEVAPLVEPVGAVPFLPTTGGVVWDPQRGIVVFDVACAAGCTGTLVFAPRTDGARSAAALTTRFSVGADPQAHAQQVALSPRIHRAVARSRATAVTIRVRDRASGRTTTTRRMLMAHS